MLDEELIEISYRKPRKERKWPEPKQEDLITDIECQDYTDEYRKYCKESYFRRTGKHYEPGAKIDAKTIRAKEKYYYSTIGSYTWRAC